MKTFTKTIPFIFLIIMAACIKNGKDDTGNETIENCVISRLSQQGDTTALSTY